MNEMIAALIIGLLAGFGVGYAVGSNPVRYYTIEPAPLKIYTCNCCDHCEAVEPIEAPAGAEDQSW